MFGHMNKDKKSGEHPVIEEMPSRIEIIVALEGVNCGNVVRSEPGNGVMSAKDKILFASGADNVTYRGRRYVKISDNAAISDSPENYNGYPLRTIQYKLK
jgi:hypothetical protein